MVCKLHLTLEQLEALRDVFDNYDWFCDCPNFPNCEDFKMFQKLKKRIDNLDERHMNSYHSGRTAHRKLKSKYMIEGANLGKEIVKEQLNNQRIRQEKSKKLSTKQG